MQNLSSKYIKLLTSTLFLQLLLFCNIANSDSAVFVSTVKDTVRETLSTNPDILQREAEKDASEHMVDQQLGEYYPKVNLRGAIGKQYVRQKYRNNALSSTGALIGADAVDGQVSSHRADPSIQLTQKIFDGFATPNRVKRSRKELLSAEFILAGSKSSRVYDGLEQYINVRRSERLLELVEKNVRTHNDILAKVRNLIKGDGEATAADEKIVLSRLYDVKASREGINGDLRTAKINFKEMVGVDAKDIEAFIIPEKEIPESAQHALATALKKNARINSEEARVQSARADFDIAKAPFMPAFDIEVIARKNYNVSGREGIETDIAGQFIGTFNVFNGGIDQSARKEMRSRIKAAKFRKLREIRNVEKNVRVAYAEYQSSNKQVAAFKKAVAEKKRIIVIYNKQFEINKVNFLNLLDVQNELFLAQGSLITAQATEDIAKIRLFAFMGTLLDYLDNHVNQNRNGDLKLVKANG